MIFLEGKQQFFFDHVHWELANDQNVLYTYKSNIEVYLETSKWVNNIFLLETWTIDFYWVTQDMVKLPWIYKMFW